LVILLASLIPLLFAGCGGGGDDLVLSDAQIQTAEKSLTSLALSGVSDALTVDETAQLQAVGTYSDSSVEALSNVVTWNVDDTSVGTVSPDGLFTAIRAGNVVVTATYEGVSSALAITVAPAPVAAKWDVPVLLIRYFPTIDGTNIDSSVTSNRVSGTIDEVRQKTVRITEETIQALENASRYHYYNNSQAPPSLNYYIEDTIEYLEPVPVHPTKTFAGDAVFDYTSIMARVDIQTYVEQRGIKEVWIWGYHPEDVWLWESNFASTEGDLSNSDRDNTDLPIFDKSYTVYNYSYQVDTPEAVHNHGHQIEAIMRHYGGSLWESFEGTSGNWRVGNVHFPPNGEFDYDYANQTVVQSDIEDWQPEGFGELKAINSDAWGSSHLGWLIYWMQSIPGDNNGLTYQSQTLTDWWAFIGNFDETIAQGAKLSE